MKYIKLEEVLWNSCNSSIATRYIGFLYMVIKTGENIHRKGVRCFAITFTTFEIFVVSLRWLSLHMFSISVLK